MTEEIKQNILKLRICVAYLGEKEQENWWSSSFLSPTGKAFLSPVFPKTVALARVNGASSAAQVTHDEFIGIGNVYHLFRLPENIEHDISQLLLKDDSVLDIIDSKDTALACISELATDNATQGVGPLLIESSSISQTMVADMAAAYKQGFGSGEKVYPYYRSKA